MQALWGISDCYKAHHYLIAYLHVFQADISGMRQGLFLLLKAATLLLRWLVSGNLTIWSIWVLSVFWEIEEVHRCVFALLAPSLGFSAEKRECLRAWFLLVIVLGQGHPPCPFFSPATSDVGIGDHALYLDCGSLWSLTLFFSKVLGSRDTLRFHTIKGFLKTRIVGFF